MVDSDSSTPMRKTRGAAASSFETAASIPSSRVETPSPSPKPARENKNKNKSTVSKSPVEKNEKEKEGEPALEIDDITMRDLAEAGTSGAPENKKKLVASGETSRTGSNSDCEIVESGTMLSETSTTTRMRRGKRRRMEADKDSEESITDAEVRQTIREDSLDALTSLSASTIASRALEWIASVDDSRARSRNIQGAVSGNMKRNLSQIKRAVTILLARVHATGDPRHLKKKVEEQQLEIIDLQAKLENAKSNEQYFKEQAADLGGSTINPNQKTERLPERRLSEVNWLVRESAKTKWN